jgi:hypothetical protein
MEEKQHASKSALENSVEDPMVTSTLGSDQEPCHVEVPQEERARHETFHEAVKQALAQQMQNEDASRRGKKVEKSDYSNLLSSQELKCLLK